MSESLASTKPAKAPLDAFAEQKTAYCIPEWLRDEQIRAALRRPGLGRVDPPPDSRPEPVSVVGFGPSLADTWERLRDFRFVISCSGAHRFLVERGIVPTWHVEVDPRPHKVQLIGPPHKGTTYLISSTCHAAVFDHLAGFDVRLWHVFDATEDGQRLLPPGEWAITGGCDVGLRSMAMAAFLGFRDIHVFGMDGSARQAGGSRHAGEHPNMAKRYSPCEYPKGSGVTYWTTPAMLAAAQQVWRELDQMPKVRATFYGEGLVQAMARDYVPKPAKLAPWLQNVVAFAKPELISAEYRDLNARLHLENLAYGVGGDKHAPTVLKLIEATKTRSVLDYGCGKGYLGKALAEQGIPIWEYDPAIPGKDESPRPADLVVATDVLEHIEPERLFYVLDDLRRCVKRVGYFVIHTGPAQKTLADGRNTHLIQHGEKWWRKKLQKFFHVGWMVERGGELHVVVAPQVKRAAGEASVKAATAAMAGG